MLEDKIHAKSSATDDSNSLELFALFNVMPYNEFSAGFGKRCYQCCQNHDKIRCAKFVHTILMPFSF